MSDEDEGRATLNLYFTKAVRDGVRKGTISTIDTLKEWIDNGNKIDSEFLKDLKVEIYEKFFEEDYGDYKTYIQSDSWKEKATKAKENAGWRCQLCNKEGNKSTLHAHHRTYERLGFELDGDIIVLCSDCHAKFHGKDN